MHTLYILFFQIDTQQWQCEKCKFRFNKNASESCENCGKPSRRVVLRQYLARIEHDTVLNETNKTALFLLLSGCAMAGYVAELRHGLKLAASVQYKVYILF